MGLAINSQLDMKRQHQPDNGHSRSGGNSGNVNRLLHARFHGHDQSQTLRLVIKHFFNIPFVNFAYVLLAWLALAPQLKGQFPSARQFAREQENRLPLDYAVFAADSAGVIRLELYYQIFNHVLQFQKVGELFEAHYEMSVTIKDKEGKQIAASSRDWRTRVASEQQATSSADYTTRQLNFDLPAGKYVVALTLRDNNARTTLSRDLDLKLDSPVGKLPTLSDIELVQFAGQKQENAKSFAKGDLTVIPSVTGSFGGEQNSKLSYYMEIYRGTDMAEQVRVETILRPKGKSMVYRDSATAMLSEPTVRQLREVSLSAFGPGDYELEVVLKGRRNKKLDMKSVEFEILWSAEAALKHDYETAIDQLAYIASGDHIKELKKPQTLEERIEAFNKFWQEHDPVPETPENELKATFYHRVSIANRRFGAMGRDGWRSDRGRIYIQFGEPDQIDDYPVAAGGRPYQLWHYYGLGPYRKFTFVDEYGDGDYRLQFPYDGLNQRPGF